MTAPLSPNEGFALLMIGILSVEAEFIWPGKVIPGMLGGAAGMVGGFALSRSSATPVGLALLGSAVLFGLLEAFWRVPFVAGLLATAAMAAGFCLLFSPPETIAASFAVPMSVVVGATAVLLLYFARRARRNKWSDARWHE